MAGNGKGKLGVIGRNIYMYKCVVNVILKKKLTKESW
jgi:hypothetical protein